MTLPHCIAIRHTSVSLNMCYTDSPPAGVYPFTNKVQILLLIFYFQALGVPNSNCMPCIDQGPLKM